MTGAVLFVTRKFPPSVGGMQEYLYQLYRRIARYNPTYRLALGRGQLNLIWFLPWVVVAGLFIALTRRVERVHVGDALLSPVGLLLARAAGAEASITIYGLDVVYAPAWYQWMVRTAVPRYDAVICISRAARDACRSRGVSPEQCHVVAPGTNLRPELDANDTARARDELAEGLSLPASGSPVVTCLGRHVRRKGFGWFVRSVVPVLPSTTRVLVGGDGPIRGEVEAAAESLDIGDRVHVLGRVSDRVKDLMLRAADVVVMPNRSVEGDMEGFGLVALEASAVGTPVVAADIEGLRDAVLEGETGVLVDEGDVAGFREGILDAAGWDRDAVKRATEESFSWDRTYAGYAEVLGLNEPGGERSPTRAPST